MTDETNFISGAKGGGHTPVEAKNTLISKTAARVLFLLSAGEIGGFYNRDDVRKSVYFNNVPVMNADGSINYTQTVADYRVGLPDQSIMPGFTNSASSFNVGQKVFQASPIIYNNSTSDVDACRVTIRFPALFQQESNGDTNGTSVSFRISRKTATGAWELVYNITKTDKANSVADVDYLVTRPSDPGTWSVRVERVTADNTVNTKQNDIYFQTATEIRYVSESYNNFAVAGVITTSEATGQSYPIISFDVLGIRIKVPSNYDVATRTYTGVWDGTFANDRETCDNPAWVLYYLLTDPDNGLGLDENYIDKYSFYDAAYYNDQLVPAMTGGVVSGTEPRYTFNYQYFDERDDAFTVCQNLAATFGAGLFSDGYYVKLVQDRPTGVSRLITNSNVIDGEFERVYSSKQSRTTACVVYWNDPNENWLAQPAYYEDSDAVARYGYNMTEVVGIGVTSEGQAIRLAKWHVETSISTTESITFKVGFKNAGIQTGEVINVLDSNFAGVMNEARVVSVTSSTITLDRPVTVTTGNSFQVVLSDGITLATRSISANATNNATISYSGGSLASNVVAGADMIITTEVSPKPYKVTTVREEKTDTEMTWTVSATEYDPTKYGRVDDTPTGPTPVYQVQDRVTSAPTGLSFKESTVNDNGSLTRKLLISWSRPTTGIADRYVVRVRLGESAWSQSETQSMSYEISPANNGDYEVEVFAKNMKGVVGPSVTGTHTVSIAGSNATTFDAPTNVQLVGGGTVSTNGDFNFEWTNPPTNADKIGTMRDYEVKIISNSDVVLRTFYVPITDPGTTARALYSNQDNFNDGGIRTTIKVQVKIRDGNNSLSSPGMATFTMTSLNAPTNLQIVGGGTTSTTPDFVFEWTNPSSNGPAIALLKDFVVQIKNGATTVRTVYVPAVAAGQVQKYTYLLSDNRTDNSGTPIRNINIQVNCRDIFDTLSAATTATFTNPAPAVPTSVSLVPLFQGFKADVTYTSPPSDMAGLAIYASETSGFVPGPSNLVYTGPINGNFVPVVTDVATVTMYVRIGAYDTFGAYNLNLTDQGSVEIVALNARPKPVVPTGLSITSANVISPNGSQSATVTATWNANTDGNTVDYTLQFRDVTGVGAFNNIITSGTSYTWTGLKNNNQYGVKIRANNVDVFSDFTSELTTTTPVDTSPPAAPTGLSATASFKNIWLDITPPNDADLAGIQVYRATTNNRASATLVATIKGDAYTDSALATGTTYYYWVRSVDTSGNVSTNYFPSSATAGVSATPATTQEIDIAAGAITETKLGAGAVTDVKIANSAITNTKIADNSISTPKMQAGSITAASGIIADLAIGTAKIQDASIVNAKLGSLAVASANIQDGAIVNAKIANLAVDAAKIANATIDNTKIGNATIKTLNLETGAVTQPYYLADTTGYSIVTPARTGSGNSSDSSMTLTSSWNTIQIPTVSGISSFPGTWIFSAPMTGDIITDTRLQSFTVYLQFEESTNGSTWNSFTPSGYDASDGATGTVFTTVAPGSGSLASFSGGYHKLASMMTQLNFNMTAGRYYRGRIFVKTIDVWGQPVVARTFTFPRINIFVLLTLK